jgi:lipopolysaccharide export system ATP-binding protein
VSTAEAIAVADCVGKSFGGRRVLTSASLRAYPGEVGLLLGRNGSGKSTLLKIAAGWLRADTGIVRFDGRTLESPRLAHLARQGMFYLPDHDLLSTAFSLRRQLEMIRLHHGDADAEESAERTGIHHLLDRRPQELSGGERRRAELACVLVRRPRCLLADEPYRGIEPYDAEKLTEVLHRLSRDGCAVVVTGHEVPTLLAFADRVTWCTSGTTYELGHPDSARRHDAFRREYLGS